MGSAEYYAFCRNGANCVYCRNHPEFREAVVEQLGIQEGLDFPCPRGIRINTPVQEMPKDIQTAFQKMQDTQIAWITDVRAAQNAVKYLSKVHPELEEQIGALRKVLTVSPPQGTGHESAESGDDQPKKPAKKGTANRSRKPATAKKDTASRPKRTAKKGTANRSKKPAKRVARKISEETLQPVKLILENGQAPGDGVMMAHAIASLHETYPGKFITDVRCPYREIFEGFEHITEIPDGEEDLLWKTTYSDVHRSNQRPVHYVNSFARDLGKFLGIRIEPAEWRNFIRLRDEEKGWFSAVYEELSRRGFPEDERDPAFWIINAGHKSDFTAKSWLFERYQKVVDALPGIWFVQVGHQSKPEDRTQHVHPELEGENVINLVGKTDLRELVRLVWHSYGVITGVSLPMVLSYAVEPHPRYRRGTRACVVVAGGREPNHWQAGPGHQYLHTCGMLPCCDVGGCWKSRVAKLGDGDEKDDDLCLNVYNHPSGQAVPMCMNMISAEQVIDAVKKYAGIK